MAIEINKTEIELLIADSLSLIDSEKDWGYETIQSLYESCHLDRLPKTTSFHTKVGIISSILIAFYLGYKKK